MQTGTTISDIVTIGSSSPRKMPTPIPTQPAAMTPHLSRERLGQLVLAVEALRAGDSSLRTAKHVHHALMLDPQWAAVTYRQVRRAVTTANARQPQLSSEQKRARRQQQERKREQQRPHRHRDRAGRSRPAEDRAARERAVHSIEVVDDGYICQGQWDPHVQTVPDDLDYCIICVDDYNPPWSLAPTRLVVSLPCPCASGDTCHWACLDQYCASTGSCPKCRRPMNAQLGDCRQYQV